VYDPETYNDFRQNWSAAQSQDGRLFFGNSSGLLSFDGARWHQAVHAPIGSAVLSLHQDNEKIHWGGVGDIGVITADSIGSYSLKSLRSKIDSSSSDFSAVWGIEGAGENIYHRASNNLYVFDGDTVNVAMEDRSVAFISSWKNRLIINIDEEGLYFKNGEDLDWVEGSEIYSDDPIFAAIPFHDFLMIASREQGLVLFDGSEFVPLNGEASKYLKEHNVYRGVAINENEAAFATLSGGILVVDKSGNYIKAIRETDGLPTDIIYNVYIDNENILWAATEFGIAKIMVNHPLHRFTSDQGFQGAPLFIDEYDDRVYVGTTEGLFGFYEAGMKRYEDLQWRVYDGLTLNGRFLISTHEGLYRLEKTNFKKISENRYLYLIEGPGYPNEAIGVSSEKIEKLEMDGNTLISETLAVVDTEIRHASLIDQELWLAGQYNRVHRYRLTGERIGSYRVDIPEDARLNQIDSLLGEIRVGTTHGLMIFDKAAGKFVPDSTFNDLDSEIMIEEVYRFLECVNGDIWFRNNRMIKRVYKRNGEWNIEKDHYRNIAVDQGMEAMSCSSDGSVWFGGSRELYRLTDPDWEYSADFKTNITGVLAEPDSLIFGGFGEQRSYPEFSYEENDLRFTYAAASHIEPEANQYRTRLRGYEEEWSSWSSETQKDYTFIPEGRYTFEVQGRNVYHKTGSIDSYSFTVLPPWYRTIWAYLGYLIIAGGVIYGGYKIRLNSILKEQRIRDGIARDLHDELSSTLSSINFFADAIDSKKLQPDESNRFLSLIQKSSHEAKEKVSDIVWVIHSDNDDWENLLLRCKRFAADLLDSKQIDYRFDVKGSFSGKPDISQRKNIWLIFREILTNIARHAEPDTVKIQFHNDAGILYIYIEDDGNGFDESKIHQNGNGVQNIKDRVKQLRGRYTLQSQPGEGTRWVIEVPVG
jgi:ligand-binding sensor domain-containing protein